LDIEEYLFYLKYFFQVVGHDLVREIEHEETGELGKLFKEIALCKRENYVDSKKITRDVKK